MANSSPLLLLFFHRASPQVPEGTLNYMATGFFTIPPNSLFTTSSLDHFYHTKDTKKNGTRHGKEQHNSEKPQRKRARRRPKRKKTDLDSSNPKNLGKAPEPKEAEKKMISSFAQVPMFLRPGNIHVPVIFEWSTSKPRNHKSCQQLCYRLSSCSIHWERDWERPIATQLLPGSATVPLIGNVFGKDVPATKTCLYYKSTASFFFFLVCPWPDLSFSQ